MLGKQCHTNQRLASNKLAAHQTTCGHDWIMADFDNLIIGSDVAQCCGRKSMLRSIILIVSQVPKRLIKAKWLGTCRSGGQIVDRAFRIE